MSWGVFYGDPPFLLSPPQHGVQTRLFSQVPSDAAFHFPTPRVLLPSSVTALFSSLPGSLCPVKLDRPVSRPPKQSPLHPATPALSQGLTSEPRSLCPAPSQGSPGPFSGTNLRRQGLGAQPPCMRPQTPLGDQPSELRSRCPAPTQASQFLVTVPIVQMVRSVLDLLFRTPTYCYTLLCIWRFLRFV